jgi:capsular polysaccharide biosynthesis protein
MELRELGDRLFRLHAKLIIAALLAGVLGGLALQYGGKPQYQATALFTMGVSDPGSAQVASGIADTARGIATGPQLVGQAISKVGADRNANAVAAAINVQTMGSSGIVSLSVTDRDPRVAVGLANALAASVVSIRTALIHNSVASSLRGLEQQEAATNAQIQKLNSQIAALTSQSSVSAIAQLNGLEGRLTSLQSLATQITVQRNNLQAQLGPQTAVIDRATSAVRLPGRGLDNALLGGVVGLVLGIAIAAVREMGRPSLVGATVVSRAIGAPLLGEMNTPPDSWTLAALPDAGSYIELAAESQNVEEVRFAALDPRHRHRRAQVRMLEGPLRRLRFNRSRPGKPSDVLAGGGPSAGLASAASTVTALPAVRQDGQSSPRTGLVVAVPRVLKAADVEPLSNFIWISGWALLGVIIYPPPRKAFRSARRGSGSGNSGRDSSIAQQVEVDAW